MELDVEDVPVALRKSAGALLRAPGRLPGVRRGAPGVGGQRHPPLGALPTSAPRGGCRCTPPSVNPTTGTSEGSTRSSPSWAVDPTGARCASGPPAALAHATHGGARCGLRPKVDPGACSRGRASTTCSTPELTPGPALVVDATLRRPPDTRPGHADATPGYAMCAGEPGVDRHRSGPVPTCDPERHPWVAAWRRGVASACLPGPQVCGSSAGRISLPSGDGLLHTHTSWWCLVTGTP